MGQILQHVARLSVANDVTQQELNKLIHTLQAMQTAITILRRDVDALIAHTKMPPLKPKRRAR